MHPAGDAILMLQVILGAGPVALYFLYLGLVNSQMRPRVIPARSDFMLLGLAGLPLLVTVTGALAAAGQWSPAFLCVTGALGGYRALMPRPGSAWVVYNIEPGQCSLLLERACRRLGWSCEKSQEGWTVHTAGLQLRQEGLTCLRNVTVHVETKGAAGYAAREALIRQFRSEVAGETQLPSATGAALVLVGVSLLGLPMWFAVRHADTIVEAVKQWFFV